MVAVRAVRDAAGVIERDAAVHLVEEELERVYQRELSLGMVPIRMAVSHVKRHELVWIVSWTSEEYLRTRDPSAALAGNGPYLVDRVDGSLHRIGVVDAMSGAWEADYRGRIRGQVARTAVDDLHDEVRAAADARGRIFAMHTLRRQVPGLSPAQVIEYVSALQGGDAPAHLVEVSSRELVPPAGPSVVTIRGAAPGARPPEAAARGDVRPPCQSGEMTANDAPPSARPRTRTRTDRARARLLQVVGAIEPWDELERDHLAAATEWIAGGAPLYRVRAPDVPAMHLVCYFVVRDEARGRLLLSAHRKAGLWLPAGGHVEPDEDPWDAVVRECREELAIEATAASVTGERPFFLTVTRTRGADPHTDVSLWYVLAADAGSVTSFDRGEFAAIRWLTEEQVLQESLDQLDPHMHRFTRKLQDAGRRCQA